MKNEIKVFAPASVTNVGPGFDIMGFALEVPGDELLLRITDKPGIRISKIEGDNGKLPLTTEENTAGASLISMTQYLKFNKGLEIELYKKMRSGSGLGSSAASAVASVFALNELLDSPLSKNQLLKFALDGEKLTSGGTPHADNVSACIFGGFIIVRSISPLDIINIPTPDDIHCVILNPDTEVKTSDARKVLPKHICLNDAVTQWGNIAGLVAGFIKSDYDVIKRSLKDIICEPVRAQLIPGFKGIKNAALDAGAIGAGISGSGPSVFAFCRSKEQGEIIGSAMKVVTDSLNIQSEIYISKINQTGPKVI